MIVLKRYKRLLKKKKEEGKARPPREYYLAKGGGFGEKKNADSEPLDTDSGPRGQKGARKKEGTARTPGGD